MRDDPPQVILTCHASSPSDYDLQPTTSDEYAQVFLIINMSIKKAALCKIEFLIRRKLELM